ncbi:alpha/beta fold hydrolase [Cobetia sp. L2A1]|uniref:alpha/beta fold hydrolase n=1 Tax=Cobetia sp. L2A1 TaxID=2686360 RepID=UPI00131BEF3E|nr:alpha/beta hydrolase [Cobetia sp. L2A1]
MHPEFEHSRHLLSRPDQQIFWQRLIRREGQGGRRLLMLHGAGVAGTLTWSPLVGHLRAHDELIIPDLRGMGETMAPEGGEPSFTLEQVVDDVMALLETQRITHFDLLGYSFGGLVAMKLAQRLRHERPEVRIGNISLLEPALLERECHSTMLKVREGYAEAARAMREAASPETGITTFLDLISPHRTRNPRAERMMVARLAHRHLGFANALDCVTHAVREIDREALLADVLAVGGEVRSMVGGKSPDTLREYHDLLARRHSGWQSLEIPGTDHSLPFQKPRRIGAELSFE